MRQLGHWRSWPDTAGPLAQLAQSGRPGQRPQAPGGRVPRSGGPACPQQQTRALPALYQALPIAITGAIQAIPGAGPDRASCQVAAETAQTMVTGTRNITGEPGDLAPQPGRKHDTPATVIDHCSRTLTPQDCP